MQKEVLVSVSGIHSQEEPGDAVEVLLPGEYYNKNGTHYIVYDQYDEETNSLLKNVIKVKNHTVELKKTGFANVRMVFEKDHNNVSYYEMEHGAMLMETRTGEILIDIQEDRMNIALEYELYINEQFVSDAVVKIKVVERKPA